MEICFTCHRYAPLIGGYETQIRLLAENLSRYHKVKVLTFKLTESSNRASCNGVEVYRVSPQLVFFRTPLSLSFFNALKRLPFDLLHAHGGVPLISDLSILHAKSRKKKTVYTHHFDGNVQDSRTLDSLANLYNKTWGRLSVKLSDAVVATSRSYAETSETLKPYLKRVNVIPCSVNTHLFKPQSEAAVSSLRKRLALLKTNVALFVGRIVPYKGLEHLVEALANLRNSGEDMTLLIVGEGEGKNITNRSQYIEAINTLVSDLGIKDQVSFLGRVSEAVLPIYYSMADVVVLPSVMRGEAFGSVLIEALACGTPVIASEIPGVKDVLKGDHKIGNYVPPGDSDALAQSMLRMAIRKREVSESCRDFAVDNYSVEKTVKSYIDLYTSLYN